MSNPRNVPQPARRPWAARRVLCDWQMPECLPELQLDAEPFVDRLVRMGVKSLLFTAQSAHGNCLYPSEVGYTNQVMEGDIFGAVCRQAKDRGLNFIAYYNQTLSFRLAKDHPGWQQVNYRGERVRFESYPMFCMNCEPYRKTVFRQMAEIARLYDIDGFMLDLNYFTYGGCYCRWCRRKFEARYGYALDFKAMNRLQHWMDLTAFLRDSRREFTLESMARCRAIKPDLTFTWNHSGDISWSHVELDAHADYVGQEGMASIRGKWMAASGKPFEVWVAESIGDWGDWTLTTEGTIKAMCSVALAHGGAVSMNLVTPPCGDYGGRVAPGVYDLMSAGMKWVARREKLCLNTRRVPVVGVLHSLDNTRLVQAFELLVVYAREAPPGSAKPEDIAWPEVGARNSLLAASLLKDIHVPVDFLFHEEAMDDLDSYEAVVLPNVGYVSDRLAEQLRAYVRKGGKLIAVYNTSLLDSTGRTMGAFSLADLFGVDYRQFSDYSIAYLDDFEAALGRGLPEMPVQVRISEYQQKSPLRVIYCSLRPGARELAHFVEPILEPDWATGHHIYHNQSPPGKLTRSPAVVLNRYGKGTCAFLPFPLLQSYERNNIWFGTLVRNLLRQMRVPRRCQVRANPAVEVVLRADAQGWLLHLLHVPTLGQSPFVNDTAPSGPVACRLHPPWPVATVEYALGRRALPFTQSQGTIAFEVPDVRIHEIVRLRRKQEGSARKRS